MRKNHSWKVFAILAAVFFALALSSCSRSKERTTPLQEDAAQKSELYQEQNNAGVFVGDKAQDFIFLDKEGNEIRLSDLRGKAIFLQFWTTWCQSCVRQMPILQEVYETYSQRDDVVFLLINVLSVEKGNDKDGVNQFLEENGYDLPVVFDMDGEVAAQYQVRGFPTTYMLDKKGNIVDFTTKPTEKEEIVEMIENALQSSEGN
ncbi:MAG TPA: TlpA family protein disulfide reductase [Clostridiales bacterium]|nr:TlpA family protein disulfide reductase [Clostridiales bacterium]